MGGYFKIIPSPVGELRLVASERGLAAILWHKERTGRYHLPLPLTEDHNNPILVETERQLSEYFAGTRRQFALQLNVSGTEFQRKVWAALLTIPFGETRSYSQIAHQIGNPAAVRAVGAANGRNPLAIITPCHRVIGAGGQLTGFAGGLGVKQHLLQFENQQLMVLAG